MIGSRSLSFEMLRALAERLPVMVTPRWVPGRARLEFAVEPNERGAAIQQTASFDPSGLHYGYGIFPLHPAAFRAMLAGIARAAMDGRGSVPIAG